MPAAAALVLCCALACAAAQRGDPPLDDPPLRHLRADEDVIDTGINAVRVRGYGGDVVTGALVERGREDSAASFLALAEHFEDSVSESNCFLRDLDWVDQIDGFAKSRGWAPPDNACSSSSARRLAPPRLDARQVFERLQRLGGVIDEVKDVINARSVGNFSEVVFPKAFPFENGQFETCTVERVTALRIRKVEDGQPVWFVLSGITDGAVTRDLPDWTRQYVTEYVGIDPATRDFVRPLWQYVKPAGEENVAQPRANFSTVLQMWGGRVGLSGVFSMDVSDTPAVIRAKKMLDRDVDQAEDALTPSNTAILALPMVMNLVPVALITDIGTTGIFIYTLLTDILTTVPFIIKGFELILMGARDTVVEETWFRGRSPDTMIVLETWAAKCELRDVSRVGTVFVVVGFAVLVTGVIAEVWAARLRRRWTRDGTLYAGMYKHLQAALFGHEIEPERKHDVTSPFFEPQDEEAAFAVQEAAYRAQHGGVPRAPEKTS